jgi:sarcosine oxidase
LPFERWRADEAAERFPGLCFDGDVCFQPDAGRCRAADALAAFAGAALAHGVEWREHERVVAIEPHADGARVQTESATFDAAGVVVAAGAWAGGLVGLAPLRVTREHYVHLPPRDGTTTWPSFIHYREPFAAYGLETPGEGIKLGEHHSGPPLATPDAADEPAFAANATRRLLEYARDWIPGVEPRAVSEATCLYTSTANEDFVLDRVGPVIVCSPCSGHGFKFAPLVGEIVADLVDGRAAPARFRLGTRTLGL